MVGHIIACMLVCAIQLLDDNRCVFDTFPRKAKLIEQCYFERAVRLTDHRRVNLTRCIATLSYNGGGVLCRWVLTLRLWVDLRLFASQQAQCRHTSIPNHQ